MTVKTALFSVRSIPGDKKCSVEIYAVDSFEHCLYRGNDISNTEHIPIELFNAEVVMQRYLAGDIIRIFVRCVYKKDCAVKGHRCDSFCKLNRESTIDESGRLQESFGRCCAELCPIVHRELMKA